MKDALGNRIKHNYEEVSKTRLTRRTPVIIRLDGKSFHTFTKGFKKPFDDIIIKTMQDTMNYLCENIQGCVLGYTQSDEITLVLQDYKELTTDAWFDYEIQKMCSVSASLATLAFNKYFHKNAHDWINEMKDFIWTKEDDRYEEIILKAIDKGAIFDSRCFNIPKEEVANCILWRQYDAERNSVLSCAQFFFSQKNIEGKNIKELKTKMETEINFVWANLKTTLKRGSCCIKNENGNWIIDNDIPRFNENREYIEKLICIN